MENDSKQYYVKLPLWKKCTFGMIDSANNFSWSYISSFLAIYLTDTFLIPAATVSLMFLLCRFWDAINDPIVGYLADRTRSRWGRYRPWIMFASAPLFITTALLFWPHPEWAVGVKTAYVVILYALVVLFYTMVNLTYGSLNSVVTQDPAERGSLAPPGVCCSPTSAPRSWCSSSPAASRFCPQSTPTWAILFWL